MPFDPHPLTAISTVATAPSPATSGLSLVVAAGEGTRFGSTFSFDCVVCPHDALPTPTNSETIRVSARATDTLTFARAMYGSVARTILVGDIIYAAITPHQLADLDRIARVNSRRMFR